jgi:hypothetical protein
MNKLNQYRNVINKILNEYEKLASQTPNSDGVDSKSKFSFETSLIFR